MPAWYPLYPTDFQFYHDPDAPRVVDTADILPAQREEALEARLAALRGELGRDIVVFTDESTYGLSRAVYAADFYDFNGYGIGSEREGVCLFVCMEEGNRGWWTCCTGPETMELYTEEIANEIDDMLYEYMAAGDYADGIADWVENFRRLYLSGSPWTPEWALPGAFSAERTRDAAAPRVVDELRLLTEGERDALEARIAELAELRQMDLVLHTARGTGAMSREEFASGFYSFGGYGLGPDGDGILLTVYRLSEELFLAQVSGFGAGAERLTGAAAGRLEDRCEDRLEADAYYEALAGWLEQTDHLLRTGRAPRSAASWGGTAVFAVMAGLVFALLSYRGAKRRMDAPRQHRRADSYLVKHGLRVENRGDTFLGSTTSRRYSPESTRSGSGGGSSGGGSSYSSSYSGSSGSSHSGSGRSF